MNHPKSVKYHFRAEELYEKKSPGEMGLAFTSVRRFEPVGPFTIDSGPEEICLVILKGEAGFRSGEYEGLAVCRDMIYMPRNSSIQLDRGKEEPVIMAYGAPAHRDTSFAHIPFAGIDDDPGRHREYGDASINCRRDVWHFINDDFDACRLMMGICRGDTGGWTSWPPHEHGREREEVYTYFDMGKAFGIQCVYEDMDEPVTIALVREGDIVAISKGYHPNTGSPAGPICFVYCMVAMEPDDRKFMDLRIQEIYGSAFK